MDIASQVPRDFKTETIEPTPTKPFSIGPNIRKDFSRTEVFVVLIFKTGNPGCYHFFARVNRMNRRAQTETSESVERFDRTFLHPVLFLSVWPALHRLPG